MMKSFAALGISPLAPAPVAARHFSRADAMLKHQGYIQYAVQKRRV
jgi:hypothetical protein